MKEVLLEEVTARLIRELYAIRLAENTISRYRNAYGKLQKFTEARCEKYFTVETAESFLKDSEQQLRAGKLSRTVFNCRRRAVGLALQVFNKQPLEFNRTFRDARYCRISPKHDLLLEDVHAYLLKQGKSENTSKRCVNLLRRFIHLMEQDGEADISEIPLKYVSESIRILGNGLAPSSMQTICSQMRVLTKALYEMGKTQINLTPAIPSCGTKSRKIIPSITIEEEKLLLESIDRNAALGKRDYAILLLGLRTGLRSSDILNLKLTDIDWRTNTITIIQQKTCNPLTLPLFPEVGNAIADYILHGRPESSLPYVFLRARPPFAKLHHCCLISNKYFARSGIRQREGEPKGFHIFRHTVATRMLTQGTAMPVISNVLGHSSVESGKVYLSTDIEHMKLCALSFDRIPPKEAK